MEQKAHTTTTTNKTGSSKKKITAKNDVEEEILVLSSSDSPNDVESEGEEEEEEQEPKQVEDATEDDDLDEEEEEADKNVSKRQSNEKTDTKKRNKEKMEEKKESVLYTFPMHRVNKMIKGENPDIRITQEAVFLINKASEKFLQLFCTEAYSCSFLDKKNHIAYKHLCSLVHLGIVVIASLFSLGEHSGIPSVVGKRRRFDFLSDFVPEKVKAEDALKEITSSSTHDQAET
ncbi:hypothetical protein RJ640_016360 [Escallonia rubra]|uniref:Transcription factor CBF/NF-Y/archaeal histone domain-containing protein n=1 Tax=Escallonia rubra TaxID=112253 RepID=A0AA88UJV3_9ASTE|nr:hypothetical protein RJ640_016360 [Escallonia rubra]